MLSSRAMPAEWRHCTVTLVPKRIKRPFDFSETEPPSYSNAALFYLIRDKSPPHPPKEPESH